MQADISHEIQVNEDAWECVCVWLVTRTFCCAESLQLHLSCHDPYTKNLVVDILYKTTIQVNQIWRRKIYCSPLSAVSLEHSRCRSPLDTQFILLAIFVFFFFAKNITIRWYNDVKMLCMVKIDGGKTEKKKIITVFGWVAFLRHNSANLWT